MVNNRMFRVVGALRNLLLAIVILGFHCCSGLEPKAVEFDSYSDLDGGFIDGGEETLEPDLKDIESSTAEIDGEEEEEPSPVQMKCIPNLHIGLEEETPVSTPQVVHPRWWDENNCKMPVEKFQWTVEQSVGNSSMFIPPSQDAHPEFPMILNGFYTFNLAANLGGSTDIESQPLTVMGMGESQIRVEAFWTVAESGCEAGYQRAVPELDIHLAHPFANGLDLDGDGLSEPWFDPVFDACSSNPAPVWPNASPQSNPLVQAFPEYQNAIVDLVIPQYSFRVGLHYPGASDDPALNSNVRVWIYGVLIFAIEGSVVLSPGDFWEVCSVDWPSGSVMSTVGSDGVVVYSNVQQ